MQRLFIFKDSSSYTEFILNVSFCYQIKICQKPPLEFLGFIVGMNGIRVDPGKIDVVEEWEPPTTVRGVQSSLGMCSFYRQFIKDYSKIVKPFHRSTTKVPFKRDLTYEQTFKELKRRLLTTPVFIDYDHTP